MVGFSLHRFAKDSAGTVVTLFAFMLPLIGGLAMFGIDYAKVMSAEASLQDAADASAVAAARELLFVSQGQQIRNEALYSVAKSIAEKSLGATEDDLQTQATLLQQDKVRVDLTLEVETFFSTVIDAKNSVIKATATAEIYGANNICFIALDKSYLRYGIEADDNAKMVAEKCAIHSNNRSIKSITALNSSFFGVENICVSGGYVGRDDNFSGSVTTDCPALDDPLAGRPEPFIESQCRTPNADEGPVDGAAMSLTAGMHQLQPGSYCGGLHIGGTADVWLQPGIYTFVDGTLTVEGDSKLTGEHVGLFFSEEKSRFRFMENAEIELSAPLDGSMAGILLRSDRGCDRAECPSRRFEINSTKVRSLLGTVYLPEDDLYINTIKPISEEAAFTILVVDQLSMKGSPTLVLNTDYAVTQVPVPDGFAGNADGIRLTH